VSQAVYLHPTSSLFLSNLQSTQAAHHDWLHKAAAIASQTLAQMAAEQSPRAATQLSPAIRVTRTASSCGSVSVQSETRAHSSSMADRLFDDAAPTSVSIDQSAESCMSQQLQAASSSEEGTQLNEQQQQQSAMITRTRKGRARGRQQPHEQQPHAAAAASLDVELSRPNKRSKRSQSNTRMCTRQSFPSLTPAVCSQQSGDGWY